MSPALHTQNSPNKSLGSTHPSSPYSLQQPRNHDSFINGSVNFCFSLGPWRHTGLLAPVFSKDSGHTSSSWGSVWASGTLVSVHPCPWGHRRLYLTLLEALSKLLSLNSRALYAFLSFRALRQTLHTRELSHLLAMVYTGNSYVLPIL